MLLHIPTNFFADLHIFSYRAGEKGVKSLHVLSHSCREGTRARGSARGTGGAQPSPRSRGLGLQRNTEEGSAAATGSPFLSRTVTAGLSAFAQCLQKSLPLCVQAAHEHRPPCSSC